MVKGSIFVELIKLSVRQILYTYLYWAKGGGGGQVPCSLPGCSWSTDDTTQKNSCFKLGAISPNASSVNPDSNVAPYAWPTDPDTTPFHYVYALIPNVADYTWLGPFTCNDQTLTYSAPTPQTQSF